MIIRMHEPLFTNGRYQRGRALRLVLIFFMLFALWHVSQHGARDVIPTDPGHDCQVCRLSHAPAVGGAAQVLFLAVFSLVARIVSVNTPSPSLQVYLPRLARGPPSS